MRETVSFLLAIIGIVIMVLAFLIVGYVLVVDFFLVDNNWMFLAIIIACCLAYHGINYFTNF
jgi:hypothetical protein